MKTPAEKGKARLGIQVHRGAVVEHAPLINLLEDDNSVRVKKIGIGRLCTLLPGERS
jgi:hypothetical protein